MFGIVLGVVALGLALYELATRDTPSPAGAAPPPLAPNAVNVRDALALAPASPGDLPTWLSKSERARFYARAALCNATAQDVRDTGAWLNQQLGASLPLPITAQLGIMHSKVPLAYWPRAARRVACVLEG